MITGLILLALIAAVGAFSYQQSKLEQRLIKDISLNDWFILLGVPLLGYLSVVFMVGSILNRPGLNRFWITDFVLGAAGAPALVYAFVGNSMHFVSKVLSRHIPPNHHSDVYRINELFHGKLSHYLTWMCAFLTFFTIVLLELNHPLVSALTSPLILLVIIAGILIGVSAARSIFFTTDYWGGNRSMFIFNVSMMAILLALIRWFSLSIPSYPAALCLIVITTTITILFTIRRIFVRFKLARRKQFRMLAKMMVIS